MTRSLIINGAPTRDWAFSLRIELTTSTFEISSTISGVLLFWAQAAKAYVSIFGQIKFFALILAAVNILAYHGITETTIADWDKAPVPPLKVRVAGLFSIVLWTVVIAAGRLMAYTF